MPKKKKKNIKPFGLFFNIEGISEKDGVFLIQPTAAEETINMHKDKVSNFSANEQGNENFTAELESGARIDSIGQYTDQSGNDYFLTAVNGKLKNIQPGSGTVLGDIHTSLTAGKYVDFETFKGSLFAVEETISPQKWTGAGSSSAAGGLPIGTDNLDQPALVEKHNNRLVYGKFHNSAEFKSHIAVSNDLDAETFTLTPASTDTNGAVIQISPGDGQSLTALKSLYNPSLGETILVCFKDKSIYQVTGTTPSTFKVSLLNDNFGALNNRCVVKVGNDLIFLGVEGADSGGDVNILSLSTASQSGTIQPKVLGSEKVRDTLKRFNFTQKDKSWVAYISGRKEVWFGVPLDSSTTVNRVIVLKLPDNPEDPRDQPVYTLRKGMNASVAMMFNTDLYTGTTNGYVRKWFGASTYAGTGHEWKYKHPFFNFGTQFQNKRIDELFAWFLATEDFTLNFKSQWRGGGNNITKSKSIPVVTGASNAKYGTAVYGQSKYASSSNRLTKVKIPVIGNGEQLQLTVSGTTGTRGPTFLGYSGLVEYGSFSRSYK